MSKLFNGLVSEGVLTDWAEILDWLFDDERFSEGRGWTRGFIGSFTKKIKRLPNLGENNYFYNAAKDLHFPESAPTTLTIMHTKGDSESRDLIRHIRNGIAHGKTTLSKPNGELHIEIVDYGKTKEQTAYMFMPVRYIFLIYEAYKQVEKSKNNAINKAKK